MSIPRIGVRNVSIPRIDVPRHDWLNSPSQSIPQSPPVTVNIGTPIINIPGCVEAHEANNGSKTLPQDDENGLLTFCDAGTPSFNPINFEPEQIIPTFPAGIGPVKNEESKPELPSVEIPAIPTEKEERIVCSDNEIFDSETNTCQKIIEEVPQPEEEIPWTEQYLPTVGQVTTTVAIAAAATTSALLAKPVADLLLKTIKPTVKKVMTKVLKILGKKEKILSVRERIQKQKDLRS